jgi:hypothetical protein
MSDRMHGQKGEKMESYTDTSFGSRRSWIYLVQPEITRGMEKKEFSAKGKDFFGEVLSETIRFENIVHTATIQHCGQYAEKLFICGGKLLFSNVPNEKYDGYNDFRRHSAEQVFVQCSNPGCGLELTPKISMSSLRHSIIHLFLKQIVPQYDVANFFNLGRLDYPQTFFLHKFFEVNKKSLDDLGTVAFWKDVFFGSDEGMRHSRMWPEDLYNDLGLIAVGGVDSSDGCDGLDRWLQFLVAQKHAIQKATINDMKQNLLGPKKAR